MLELQCTTAARSDDSQGLNQRPFMHVEQDARLLERDSGIAIGCEVLDLLQLPCQLPRSAMSTPSLPTKMLTCRGRFQEPSDTDA